MNGATNSSPRLFSEVAYDTTCNENRRLEDRRCTALSPAAHAPQEDEEVEERKEQLPLKSGFDEVFIDVALPSATNLVSKDLSIKKRLEEMRLTDCDITEIPAAALQDEIDAKFERRKRSRKAEKESSESEEERKSIRIGVMYQADLHSRVEDEEPTLADLGTDQIWDPHKAAALPAHELEQYLNRSDDFNIRMVLLEALHCANYDLEKATRMFYRIHAQRPGLSVEFSQAECEQFDSLCRDSVIGQGKDFREAARLMNRPVETVLTQYYNWKGKNREAYNLLKNRRRREPDRCCFCKDGGLLIVCNSCCRAFHLECLQPPLKEVPDGDWFCTLCSHHSPARLRRSPKQNANNLPAIRLDFEEQSPRPNSKPRMDVRLQQLKAAHKELSLLTNARVTSTLKPPPNNHQIMDSSPASMQDYGNLYSDDDNDDERKYKESPTELDDSTKDDSDSDYKSDENENDDDVDDIDASSAAPDKRRTKVTDSVASSSISIEVILPICSEGFRMKIGVKRDGTVALVEFSRGEKGDKGYAEVCNLIHLGDVITHVDGEPCDKDIHKTMSLMVAPNGFGAKVMRITRNVIAGQLPSFHLPMAHSIEETDSRYLTFLLPLLPEGFCLKLVEKRGVCKIEGYSEKNGKTGFAEFYNLFRPGDEIVAIDGYSCVGLLLRDVLPLFGMASPSGWRAVTIRRWIQSLKKANTPETQTSSENALPENQSVKQGTAKSSPIVNSAERGTLPSTETTESVSGNTKVTTLPPVGPADGVGSFANCSVLAPTASRSGMGGNSFDGVLTPSGNGVGGYAISGALSPTASTSGMRGSSICGSVSPSGPAYGVGGYAHSGALPPNGSTNGMGGSSFYGAFPPSGPANGVARYANSGALPPNGSTYGVRGSSFLGRFSSK